MKESVLTEFPTRDTSIQGRQSHTTNPLPNLIKKKKLDKLS